MRLDLPPVSELPSGKAQECGKFEVAKFASRHPGPCESFDCLMRSRCKESQLACKAFVTFIHSGRLREPDPETASRARFKLIFDSKD
jgi:hypothetical protein